jgi:hypothetical protein
MILNKANLPVHYASLFEPTPTSVVFTLNSSLKLPPGIVADLEPVALNLYSTDKNSPYLRVNLPGYHLDGTKDIAVTSETTPILNVTAFEGFLANVIESVESSIYTSGSPVLKIGALKYKLQLNKKITVLGKI